MSFEINEPMVRKLLEVVDQGLVQGLGIPEPGKLCVEAAISYALGEPHSDGPSCVEQDVRQSKIALNDAPGWSSDAARAKGLRAVAIAQLGSRGVVDGQRYLALLAEKVIRRIVPIAMRAAAAKNPKHAAALEAAAVRCEQEGTLESARAAHAAAYAAYADAAAYAAAAKRDEMYSLLASLMVETLGELGSPGCDWLWLVDESAVGAKGN